MEAQLVRVSRGELGYASTRRSTVWNGRVPDRYPDQIVQPETVEDVQDLVHLAEANDQTIAIKSGGHDYHGACLRDGGMLLDLGSMDRIQIDAKRGHAWVEPGATNRSLTRSAQDGGFAFPTGHHPGVGLGGYLLAGGLGWNPTSWGPACWSVRAIQAVSVDGNLIEADDDHNPELLWVARGGAAGFPAIVTRFQLELKQLPRVMSCVLTYPLEALPFLLGWIKTVRIPGVELSVIARASDPQVPGGRASARVALTCFGSTSYEVRELIYSVVESVFAPEEMLHEPKPTEISFQEIEGDGSLIKGLRYSVDGGWTDSHDGEIGTICAEALVDSPSALTRFVFARSQFPEIEPDAAFSILGSSTAHAYAIWKLQEDDAINIAWVRDLMSDLGHRISGFWPAQSNLQAGAGRTRMSFSPEKWDRLSRIRADYDPDNRKFGFLE